MYKSAGICRCRQLPVNMLCMKQTAAGPSSCWSLQQPVEVSTFGLVGLVQECSTLTSIRLGSCPRQAPLAVHFGGPEAAVTLSKWWPHSESRGQSCSIATTWSFRLDPASVAPLQASDGCSIASKVGLPQLCTYSSAKHAHGPPDDAVGPPDA